MKRWLKYLAWCVIAFLVAALVVPYIPAGKYGGSIKASLESALGRKVEIGSVRFRLLPQPGFTVENVTIGDDPAIGFEPVAYVTTLRAVPSLKTLFGGALQFASVDLQDASINLTRVDSEQKGVRWNFSSLLQPGLLATFPSVHLRGGRVNFKFGDTKSLFYLLDTDVDLWPPGSAGDPWTLRVHGEPSRTDRTARGFGSFLARGQWFPRESTVALDARLEPSELGDMLTLFNGAESGMQGAISGNFHLAGPLNRIGLSGRLSVANLHGWDQKPPGGNEWPFLIGGEMDAATQSIDLYARLASDPSPLTVRYRVADYLRRPHWGVTANLSKFPLAPLPGIAGSLGWTLPAGFALAGTADGAVGYASPGGTPQMDGELNVANSTISVPGAPPLRLGVAGLRFAGATVRLEPVELRNEKNQTAMLEATWDAETRAASAHISSEGMAIDSLRREGLLHGIPALGLATAGTWNGELNYSGASGWAGKLHLTDTDIPFEAFSEPLHLLAADVTVNSGGLDMTKVNIAVGGMEAQGEYAYDSTAPRPHKFRLSVPKASGPAIEKLFLPALRRGNFFTYAFNFGRVPEPDWLRGTRAEGAIQIEELDLGGTLFTKLRSRILWDGTGVELAALQARMGAAVLTGAATIQLADRQPVYRVEGKLAGMSWRSGNLNAEGALAASGVGADLLTSLKAQGTFRGKAIDLTPVNKWDTVAGSFDWSFSGASDKRLPRLKLDDLVMKTGAATWKGTAETQGDGQILLRLSDGAKNLQAAGAILRGEPLKPVAP